MRGIAFMEFRVEDVDKTADQLTAGYGFRPAAGRPEPGPGRPLALAHGAVRVLLSGPDVFGPGMGYAGRHGDGVSGMAVACDDPDDSYRTAVAAGAPVLSEAERVVEVFDDFTLRFVGLEELPEPDGAAMFEAVDHLAICVPSGTMASVVGFCRTALGLRRIFGEFVEVGPQAMDSVVVQNPAGTVTFTLLEPCVDRQPGQIDAFLAAHEGPGVQHLALRTADIAGAVRTLAGRGVGFLTTPGAYYDGLEDRLGPTGIPVAELRELNVLVDSDHGGQLFQIFTRSTHPRRTFFFELIERRGAATFGTANIRALYEAVERQTITPDR